MKAPGPKMLWCNCICAWHPVRVVHGDGHIRRLPPPVTVSALLQYHPHHFVCEPTSTGPLFHSGMLPFDMELEEGRLYLLLPLPRLLPHLATTPACPCFSQCRNKNPAELDTVFTSEEASQTNTKGWLQNYSSGGGGEEKGQGQGQGGGEFLVVDKKMRKLRLRLGKSKWVRALVRGSKRLVPESLGFRFSWRRGGEETKEQASMEAGLAGKAGQYSCSRNRWRPGLECISEVDLLTGLLNNRDSEVNDCR